MAPVSPVLSGLTSYPFVRLEEAKRAAAARGVELIDFGVGDPREPTAELIRRALRDSVAETHAYPLAQGLPELRDAVAAWCGRRFGVDLDPDREVIPTLGSKEAIFTLALVVVDRDSRRNVVVVTEPGYPVPERGALFAGAETVRLPLREEHGFVPDLDAVPAQVWERIALFWVNYPNNPTGATSPPGFYDRLAGLARQHDFVLASDEAYSELWFDEPPGSVLQVPDRRNVLAFNTLSKRSSMTGYRCGFAAGDPELVAALRAFRPNVGTAPQEFVQRAGVVAWSDEEHVEATREVYRRKREVFLELFARKGIRVAGGAATIYLWIAVPEGESSEAFATRLLEHGVVVSPGSYLGAAGEGYARVALVPPLEDCRRAASILEEVL
jgi:succinyldiaminopimelate transaminase